MVNRNLKTLFLGGMKIAYIDKGDSDVLIIFPDNLYSSMAYTDDIDWFSSQFRVISFDYPGTGSSTREIKYQDEIENDLWVHRADLAAHLLCELGINSCHVMGTGFGALAALHFTGNDAELHRISVKGAVFDSFLAIWDKRDLHRSLDPREHYYVRNRKKLEEQHGDDWRQVVDSDTLFLRKLADKGGYRVSDCILNSINCPVFLTGIIRHKITPGIAREYARISTLIPDCTIFLDSGKGNRVSRKEKHSLGDPLIWVDLDLFRKLVALFMEKHCK